MYCVPLYDSLGDNAVEFILAHSGAAAVFVGGDKLGLLAAAATLGGLAGALKTVVAWGEPSAKDLAAAKEAGLAVATWAAFRARGAANPAPPSPPAPADLCTIMYTSGTTGDPKGVEMSHAAVVATVAGLERFLETSRFGLGPDDAMLSYLPLAHIFDRVAEELFLNVGGRIGYFQGQGGGRGEREWRWKGGARARARQPPPSRLAAPPGDVRHLVDDISALRPTLFLGVPRVFDRVYAGATAKIKAKGGIAEFLFNWGFARKLYALRAGVPHNRAAPIFDRLVFSKLKAALGGRVRLICSGGAPLARHVEDFLAVAMCAPVVQGYGLTETCAASFIAVPGQAASAGTVGPPLPSVGLRLEAVPDMGCDPGADPPKGEVCIVGPTLFSGYYKDKEKTDEVLDADGVFHTGDIGELTPEGLLRIVDRKKNIFKLSQGVCGREGMGWGVGGCGLARARRRSSRPLLSPSPPRRVHRGGEGGGHLQKVPPRRAGKRRTGMGGKGKKGARQDSSRHPPSPSLPLLPLDLGLRQLVRVVPRRGRRPR
jgi:long-chain acyl-CoA synthetase